MPARVTSGEVNNKTGADQVIEYSIRFAIGGIMVSLFAIFGDVLRPKSLAGLFGAAPSVALATLGIAVYQHGLSYAAAESRSMMAGAVAFTVYVVVVRGLLARARWRASAATLAVVAVWLIVALGLHVLAAEL